MTLILDTDIALSALARISLAAKVPDVYGSQTITGVHVESLPGHTGLAAVTATNGKILAQAIVPCRGSGGGIIPRAALDHLLAHHMTYRKASGDVVSERCPKTKSLAAGLKVEVSPEETIIALGMAGKAFRQDYGVYPDVSEVLGRLTDPDYQWGRAPGHLSLRPDLMMLADRILEEFPTHQGEYAYRAREGYNGPFWRAKNLGEDGGSIIVAIMPVAALPTSGGLYSVRTAQGRLESHVDSVFPRKATV